MPGAPATYSASIRHSLWGGARPPPARHSSSAQSCASAPDPKDAYTSPLSPRVAAARSDPGHSSAAEAHRLRTNASNAGRTCG